MSAETTLTEEQIGLLKTNEILNALRYADPSIRDDVTRAFTEIPTNLAALGEDIKKQDAIIVKSRIELENLSKALSALSDDSLEAQEKKSS